MCDLSVRKFIVVLTVLFFGYSHGEVIEIQGPDVTSDAYVDTYHPTTNYNGGSYRLNNYSNVQTCWGLVKFDLPTLEAGQYISDATMTFDYFANGDSANGALTVGLNQILYSWDETEVTWQERFTGVAWQEGNIGWADGSGPVNYSADSLGSVSLPFGEFGLVTFQSMDLTSVLNQMAKGEIENNGFILNTGRNYGPYDASWYFASSDRADQVKPLLTLTVVPEPATLILLSVGGLVGLRRRRNL